MKGIDIMRFSKKQIRIICWVIAGAMIVAIGAGVIGMFTSI